MVGGIILAFSFFKSKESKNDVPPETSITADTSHPTNLTETPSPLPSKAPSHEVSGPIEAFESKTNEALGRLPKQVPLQGLTDEEVHHMPQSEMEALNPFFEIVQAVAENPKLEPTAFNFYKKCATDDNLNLATTLRSRCLSKMRALAPHLDHQREIDELIYFLKNKNPDIVRLSDEIPD